MKFRTFARMRIAVNTRFLFKDALEGFGVYTEQILSRLVAAHPEIQFDSYFDRKPHPSYKYAENVALHWFHPKARHPFLFYVWYQKRLKQHVERSSADLLWSPDGFMPTGMSIPTVLTIHDVAYARYPNQISARNLKYYERNMAKFGHEAAHIITVSNFSKTEICDVLGVPEEKVSVVYNGVPEGFNPASKLQVEASKQLFADGSDYFVYVGAIHPRKNIPNLIHAFGLFKDRTASSMKLIIAGRESWQVKEVSEAISRSRHKLDIKLTGYVQDEQLPSLIGGATAMTYVSLYEGFGLPVAEAMACGIPVIVSNSESTGAVLSEVAGDAGMSCDPLQPESIAQAMYDLVTQTGLRDTLIQKGLKRAQMFDWEMAAKSTFEILSRYSAR